MTNFSITPYKPVGYLSPVDIIDNLPRRRELLNHIYNIDNTCLPLRLAWFIHILSVKKNYMSYYAQTLTMFLRFTLYNTNKYTVHCKPYTVPQNIQECIILTTLNIIIFIQLMFDGNSANWGHMICPASI